MIPAIQDHNVRTTLTLDDDVARQLQRETQRCGQSFNEAVNHFLRLGLRAARKREPFVVTPITLGLPEDYDFDNVEKVIEMLEGPMHC